MGFLSIQSILPPGTVLPFAGSVAPAGWALCNGSAVSRTTYNALFSAIGVAHGSGDTTTTFNLPDYRGRFLRGLDSAAGRDPDSATRTAMNTGGNTGNAVGSVQSAQYGSHKHTITGATTTNSGPNNGWGMLVSGGNGITQIFSNSPADISNSMAFNGGNETRPLNANVNYIIKL